MIHHWAHRAGDCDPWWEPETEWHREWKGLVRPECSEVVMGAHRADIVANGLVIELQHSTITMEEAREREEFYDRMIWVIDARPFEDNLVRWSVTGERWWCFWMWPRKTIASMTRPVYLDMGGPLVYRLDSVRKGFKRTFASGITMPREQFVSKFLGCAAPPGQMGLF